LAITVVGSVAFDAIETRVGKRDELLGGSATYFSIAASKFTEVNLVAVVGEDFDQKHIDFLAQYANLSGVAVEPGETFRWAGKYSDDMNDRETLATHLNVFADFSPKIPEKYRSCETVFLANIDPDLQSDVLRALGPGKRLVGLDTMNLWINVKRESLKKALKQVDILMINEDELRQLSCEPNVWAAGLKCLGLGPEIVVCKRGEYGSILFSDGAAFALPAFGTQNVVDPTGAGDSFAGAFFGYLDKQKGWRRSDAQKNALVLGTVVASFTVEAFGVDGLVEVDKTAMHRRLEGLSRLCDFAFDFDF